jgi:hypothetical protein
MHKQTNNKTGNVKAPDKFAKELRDIVRFVLAIHPDPKMQRLLVQGWIQKRLQETKSLSQDTKTNVK